MTLRWLPHTADIRVELTGSSLADLLGQASGAVRELLVGQSVVRPQAVRPLSVSGLDDTELVFAFLRALLDLYYRDQFVPGDTEVSELTYSGEGVRASATIRGELFDAARHEAQPEVKAVTRHGLRVARTDAGWLADVVFDV